MCTYIWVYVHIYACMGGEGLGGGFHIPRHEAADYIEAREDLN